MQCWSRTTAAELQTAQKYRLISNQQENGITAVADYNTLAKSTKVLAMDYQTSHIPLRKPICRNGIGLRQKQFFLTVESCDRHARSALRKELVEIRRQQFGRLYVGCHLGIQSTDHYVGAGYGFGARQVARANISAFIHEQHPRSRRQWKVSRENDMPLTDKRSGAKRSSGEVPGTGARKVDSLCLEIGIGDKYVPSRILGIADKTRQRICGIRYRQPRPHIPFNCAIRQQWQCR